MGRQKPPGEVERLDGSFRPTIALWAVVASRIMRTRRATIAIAVRAVFPPIRLAWSAPFAIAVPVPIPRPIVAAPGRVRVLAFEVGVVVRTRGLIRPGGQHSQVEEVLSWRWRRH